MICKHFNVGIDYVNAQMPWKDWYPCLIVALIAEEREVRQAYLAGGGEPDKWRAIYDVDAPEVTDGPVSGKDVGSAILKVFGGSAIMGDMKTLVALGRATPVELLRDADGNYYDMDGNPIDFEKLGVAFIEGRD